MMESLTDMLNWLEDLPPLLAYAALLVIAYGENVVPPIPGDMAIVFGGYLVGVGHLSFIVVVLLATIGGVLGFMTMYAVGYRIGDAVMDPDRLRWMPKDKIKRANSWLDRYGYAVVAVNRFLSGLRSVISLSVGMAHTEPWTTAFYAALSSAVWTALITYAGFALGENWPVVADYLRDYGRAILGLVVAAVLVQSVRWYLKRRGSTRDRDGGGNFNSTHG